METTAASAGREVLEQFLAAAERRDMDAVRARIHADVVMEWPQSGERFTGRENAIGAVSAADEPPEFAGEPRILGEGDSWVVMMPLRYGTDTYHYVGVFELDGGLIRHSTEYFGAPFPPQEARARFADAPQTGS
jgi:hypothetical protein